MPVGMLAGTPLIVGLDLYHRPAMEDGLTAALEKMRADGAPDVAIETFRHYYERLAEGETGTIAEDEIEPGGDLPTAADLPEADGEAPERGGIIRRNGGGAPQTGG